MLVLSVLFYLAAGAGIIFFLTNVKAITKRTKLFVLNVSHLCGIVGVLLTRLDIGYFSQMNLVTLLSLMSSYLVSVYAINMRK